MRHPFLARSFEVEDVVGIVRLNFAQRVKLYDGPAELSPGNIGDMLAAYDTLRAHAPSPHHIIPGTTRWSCGSTRRRGRSSKAWWSAST
jgi:hypothetical protein